MTTLRITLSCVDIKRGAVLEVNDEVEFPSHLIGDAEALRDVVGEPAADMIGRLWTGLQVGTVPWKQEK